MQRGEYTPGVNVFSQIHEIGEKTFTRVSIRSSYYRDGEWDVFSGDEWLDDDDALFSSDDAEDIFLALEEEGGDADEPLARVREEIDEFGKRVVTYSRGKTEEEEEDRGDRTTQSSLPEEEDILLSKWLEEREIEYKRINPYMFSNETGENETPSTNDDDERRRIVHMSDYL